MKIRLKITLSYFAIILIFVSQGGYVIIADRVVAEQVKQLDQQYELTVIRADELEETLELVLAMGGSLLALHEVLLGEAAAQDELLASIQEFDVHYVNLQSLYQAEAAHARATNDPLLSEIEATIAELESIKAQHGHFHADTDQLFAYIASGQPAQAAELVNNELDAELKDLETQLLSLEDNIKEKLHAQEIEYDERIDTVQASIDRLRTITIILLILSVLVAGGFSIWISNSLTRPIHDLSQAAASIEQGSFELQPLDKLTKRRDEFSLLSRVFKRMAEEVRTREKRLQQQVRQLRIKIDRADQDKQVTEITKSDFFQDLEAKVAKLRESTAGSAG